MTFFDQKTEVISLELTPYGRYLLAEGKLMPKYYEIIINKKSSNNIEKDEPITWDDI